MIDATELAEAKGRGEDKRMSSATNLGKYARPTVDYIFKRVFGTEQNKICPISLLNSLLPLDIVDFDFENTELAKGAERKKGAQLIECAFVFRAGNGEPLNNNVASS